MYYIEESDGLDYFHLTFFESLDDIYDYLATDLLWRIAEIDEHNAEHPDDEFYEYDYIPSAEVLKAMVQKSLDFEGLQELITTILDDGLCKHNLYEIKPHKPQNGDSVEKLVEWCNKQKASNANL